MEGNFGMGFCNDFDNDFDIAINIYPPGDSEESKWMGELDITSDRYSLKLSTKAYGDTEDEARAGIFKEVSKALLLIDYKEVEAKGKVIFENEKGCIKATN